MQLKCLGFRPAAIKGSFKNKALENEDWSTKHPNLKIKHPKLENEAPKTLYLSVP